MKHTEQAPGSDTMVLTGQALPVQRGTVTIEVLLTPSGRQVLGHGGWAAGGSPQPPFGIAPPPGAEPPPWTEAVHGSTLKAGMPDSADALHHTGGILVGVNEWGWVVYEWHA